MEKYTVSGYVFDTKEEALAAKKELSLVQSICQKMGGDGEKSLDISNPKHAKAVYDRIVARDMFHTVVGQEFLESLRMSFESPENEPSAADAAAQTEEEAVSSEERSEVSGESAASAETEPAAAEQPEETAEASAAVDEEELDDFSRQIELETQKSMIRAQKEAVPEQETAAEDQKEAQEASVSSDNKMALNLDIFDLGEEPKPDMSLTRQMAFSFDDLELEEEAKPAKEAVPEESKEDEEEDFHSMWKKKALDVLYDTEEETPRASAEMTDDYETVTEEEEDEEDVPESRHYRGLFFNSFVLNIILLAGLITLCLYAFGSDNANMLNYERVLNNQYQEKMDELQREYESMKEDLTAQQQDAAE